MRIFLLFQMVPVVKFKTDKNFFKKIENMQVAQVSFARIYYTSQETNKGDHSPNI